MNGTMSVMGRLCCKSPKMLSDKFLAGIKSGRCKDVKRAHSQGDLSRTYEETVLSKLLGLGVVADIAAMAFDAVVASNSLMACLTSFRLRVSGLRGIARIRSGPIINNRLILTRP